MVVVELQEMSATPGGGGKFFFAVSKPGPDFVEPQFPANPPVVGVDPATSDPIEKFAWWRGMPILCFYLRMVLPSMLASSSLGHTLLEFDIPNIIAPTSE